MDAIIGTAEGGEGAAEAPAEGWTAAPSGESSTDELVTQAVAAHEEGPSSDEHPAEDQAAA